LKRGLKGTYVSVEPFHLSGIWMSGRFDTTSGKMMMRVDSLNFSARLLTSG
jgi:hypothetical protein